MQNENSNDTEGAVDSGETPDTEFSEQKSTSGENLTGEELISESDLKDKRQRTRSLKGLQMDLDNARNKRNRAGKALKEQIKSVDELMRQSADLRTLTAGLERLQMNMDELKFVHEKTLDLTLQLHEDDTEDYDYFSAMSKAFVECAADAKTRINMLEQERMETLSQRSHGSIRTSASKASQLMSSSKRAAADAAALKAKMNSLKRQQELERKQELLRNQQRELERLEEQERLQGELDAAEARKIVLEETQVSSRPKTSESPPETNNGDTTNPETLDANKGVSVTSDSQRLFLARLHSETPAFSPLPNDLQSRIIDENQFQLLQRENTKIQRQQVALLKRMTLPIPKPPIFSGDILEYPKWSSAFDALIEEDAIKPSHKLYYLGEYTSGKAQKMITGLLGLQTEDAYQRARNVLKERFGNPYNIYEAYRENLRAWPVCSTANELQEFSDFLLMTQETMKTVKYLKEFDNFSAIRELAGRLPSYYTNKWREHAKKIDHKQGEYTFHDFVNYTQEAASDATHPVFSHEALAVTRKQIQRGVSTTDKRFSSEKRTDKKANRGTSFASTTGSERSNVTQQSSYKDKCFLCCKQHDLENCPEFLKMSVEERTTFARTKGLCFACLTKGHMTRQCEQKRKCKICKKPHVTALHFYDRGLPKGDQQAEVSSE